MITSLVGNNNNTMVSYGGKLLNVTAWQYSAVPFTASGKWVYSGKGTRDNVNYYYDWCCSANHFETEMVEASSVYSSLFDNRGILVSKNLPLVAGVYPGSIGELMMSSRLDARIYYNSAMTANHNLSFEYTPCTVFNGTGHYEYTATTYRSGQQSYQEKVELDGVHFVANTFGGSKQPGFAVYAYASAYASAYYSGGLAQTPFCRLEHSYYSDNYVSQNMPDSYWVLTGKVWTRY